MEFPCRRVTMAEHLASVGIRTPAHEIKCADEENIPIKVKIFGESEFGKKLASVISAEDTLSLVNSFCEMYQNMPYANKQDIMEGWGYAGWEDHSFNSANQCTVCGYQKKCTHSSTKTVYSYENGNMHSYYATCNSCGEKLEGYGYAGWSDHVFSGNSRFRNGQSDLRSKRIRRESKRYDQLQRICVFL